MTPEIKRAALRAALAVTLGSGCSSPARPPSNTGGDPHQT